MLGFGSIICCAQQEQAARAVAAAGCIATANLVFCLASLKPDVKKSGNNKLTNNKKVIIEVWYAGLSACMQ